MLAGGPGHMLQQTYLYPLLLVLHMHHHCMPPSPCMPRHCYDLCFWFVSLHAALQRLQLLSDELGVPQHHVLQLVARHEPLLLVPPDVMAPRLQLLAAALQEDPAAAAVTLLGAPRLLTRSPAWLAARTSELAAVCAARGLQVHLLLRGAPDLLLRSPATLCRRLQQLPAALEMPPAACRQLLHKRPGLLRRSTDVIHSR